MSRTSTLIVLGALVILVPYSGLPAAMRGVLEVAFGALVLSIGLWMRSKEMKRAPSPAPEPFMPAQTPSAPPQDPEETPPPPQGVSPI